MKAKLLRDCKPFGRTGEIAEVSPDRFEWLTSLGIAIPVTEAREQAEAVFETKTILQLPNHPEEMALLTGEMSQGEYREKASQLKDEILGMIRIKD